MANHIDMKKIIPFYPIIIFIFSSCHLENSVPSISLSQEKNIDSAQSSCPFLTKDNNNNIVLSWVRETGSDKAIVCYAVSKNKGKTFDSTIEVTASDNVYPHGENMPKLIFKPSGEIIAVWGAANKNPKNAYAGLVYYSVSFDNGKTWASKKLITNDTASYDQRYFDVALLPSGEAAIVWLDNRKTINNEGSGLYYAVTKNKGGFQSEKLISEPCCQCCRTDLFIDQSNNIHVLYRAIINDSIRDIAHIESKNNGQTFSRPERISNDNWVINGCPHTGPCMAENKEGLHCTWFTGGNEAGVYYTSLTHSDTMFSSRDMVSGYAAKHSQIASLPQGNLITVWDESVPVNNTYSSCIGLEEKDAENKNILRRYITDKNSGASFPVICTADKNKVLVAFTKSNNDKKSVVFKQVQFNN
jgi:hypothetical protein